MTDNDDLEKKKIKDLQGEVDKWKGLSRKHEDQAKANKSAVDDLAELKRKGLDAEGRRDADQKALDDKLGALEKDLAEAKVRALRAEVASEKGLTPAQARRLQGESREDLERDADDLLETFPVAKSDKDEGDPDKGRTTTGARPATKRPTEALSGGTDPSGNNEVVETDPAKLAESVPRT